MKLSLVCPFVISTQKFRKFLLTLILIVFHEHFVCSAQNYGNYIFAKFSGKEKKCLFFILLRQLKQDSYRLQLLIYYRQQERKHHIYFICNQENGKMCT